MVSLRKRIAFFTLLLIGSAALQAQMRMIPHLTRADGGFTTTVILENHSVSPVDYRLQPYDQAGASLDEVSGSLDGGATAAFEADELFAGETDASHFEIEGEGIEVTLAYRAIVGGSPAHVSEGPGEATRFRFFAGNWDTTFDGFAVVNTGSEAVDVWVSQRDYSGRIVKSVRAIAGLGVNAKGLYIIGQPSGSEFEDREDAFFEVYANQPMAMTALRGNIPGSTFLWANIAEARGHAETTRDAQSVWYIENGSLYDVFEVMGYNVATDRLWQAETFRRQARGTLSERFGSTFLTTDQFARALNYTDEEYLEGFADLSADARTAVRAYVDGFNRFIAEVRADPSLVPVEFNLLGFLPSDWTTTDALSVVVILLRTFDPNNFAQGQLDNAAILEYLNQNYPATAADMFEDLRWLNDPDAQTMIADPAGKRGFLPANSSHLSNLRTDIDFKALKDKYTQILLDRERQLERIDARLKMGSYAWAVSGDKTASGNPMIYSGPQMGFMTPSVVLEGSIRGGGLEISGMSVPGVPGIVIGRTPHHAWSMQVGHAHTADLYVEPPAALSGGPHHTEIIKVSGLPDVQFDVFRTQHGPVILQSPSIVSWKYAHWGYEFATIEGFLNLAKAQSIEEFGEGVAQAAVSQHFCYADRDGNIAYWMSGRDPVRPEGEYRLPQGSLGPVLEYDTAVRKPIPHDSNPERGFFGGWNNKSRSDYDNAPFGGSHTYGPFHRAHVIEEFLESHDNLTYEQVRDLAIDIAATDSFGLGGNPWPFVAERFKNAVAEDPSQSRNDAIAILDNWDGHFVDGGEIRWINGPDRADGWMLMDAWITRVIVNTFGDELPSFSLTSLFNAMLHGMDLGYVLENRYDWFSNLSDSAAAQTPNQIIVQSLDEVLAELGNRPWGIGDRGFIAYQHEVLNQTFSTTPFGSRSTYAHCVEYGPGGPVRIESMFPLGESGNIYSGGGFNFDLDPHFLSMQQFFNNFSPRPFPLFQ